MTRPANRSTNAPRRKADKPEKTGALPQELSDRLAHLATLLPNWDSYGAVPISSDAITRTKAILRRILALGDKGIPLPFIGPSGDGTLVLEWKTPAGKELILDIPLGEEPLPFLLVEPQGPEGEVETEGVIGETLTLAEVIRRLQAE